MAPAAETARRAVDAWISTEVLAAQVVRDGWNGFAKEKLGQQRNRATSQEDGASLWEAPRDGDAAPWSQAHGVDADEESRPWYAVVLGALPARASFQRLDSVFGDETDEDRVGRRLKGDIVAATAVLDGAGKSRGYPTGHAA